MASFRLDVERDVVLRVHGCGGDVEIMGHDDAAVEIEADDALERYVNEKGDAITISGYPGDLRIAAPREASVELSGVAGDLEVHSLGHFDGRDDFRLSVDGVGGDVDIADVVNVRLGSVGGDAEIKGACRRIEAGHIGGDLEIERTAVCRVQAVGGDAHLDAVERLLGLGHIGGDLVLRWSGEGHSEGEGELRGIVGGDAVIKLPPSLDMTLAAVVGGDLQGRGEEWKINRGSGSHELIFGDGTTRLSLTVGGDLNVRGGPAPRSSGSGNGDWGHVRGSMDSFGEEMRGLGRELEEMGRNLARELSGLGQEIAREVRVAGREARRDMKDDFRSPFGRWQRGRVRINDREFNLDPEQIERIKREARAAAAGGVARAQEAVERALRQWQHPQGAPPRPASPRAPTPPRAPNQPPVGGVYTGQTIRMDTEGQQEQPATSSASPADLDAERLAILRMVHEGRLAPNEAEVLLRGLEERS